MQGPTIALMRESLIRPGKCAARTGVRAAHLPLPPASRMPRSGSHCWQAGQIKHSVRRGSKAISACTGLLLHTFRPQQRLVEGYNEDRKCCSGEVSETGWLTCPGCQTRFALLSLSCAGWPAARWAADRWASSG